jgi:hypothetical protein
MPDSASVRAFRMLVVNVFLYKVVLHAANFDTMSTEPPRPIARRAYEANETRGVIVAMRGLRL